MPRLSELTDVYYDPMGNASGALPVDQPFKSNEVEGLPVKFSDEPKVPEESTPLSNNVDKILNAFFRDDDKRLQLWPEKVLRAGATAAGKVASGAVPQWSIDKDTGEVHTSPQMIEKAQEVAALAGTGGLAGGGGSLNATPSLRPALKYNGKLYKGKPGQEHMDVIPADIYPTFQKQAMSGEDISNFNFGFINDKGHFLSREDALKYGIDNGLIDPQAGKYGALTSTLMADSSKPGVAIESMKTASPFFSALEHNVGQIPQAKMTGEQWAGTLSNKPGVKPEEMQWTGLSDFLAENKGKPVTKAQIEEHLASNKVELKEVNKGNAIDESSPVFKQKVEEILTKAKANNEPMMQSRAEDMAYDQLGMGPTKYKTYQLPGGENYREKLLTLPNKPKLTADGLPHDYMLINENAEAAKLGFKIPEGTPERWSFKGPDISSRIFKTREEAVNEALRNAKQQEHTGEYRSSHWDEPNILAHVRMNDRTIDGKKALHLEEIQSDWHQAGREKGYKSEAATKEYDKMIEDKHTLAQKVVKLENELKAELGKGYDLRNLTDADKELLTNKLREAKSNNSEYQKANKAYTEVADKVEKGNPYMGVPDAPFKKNWSELALKRMLREASENGYDRLSWTAGEHHPTNPKNLKQTGEAAEKADKGMQGFYNDIIPKIVEKLGKEHGVKVKSTMIEEPYKSGNPIEGKFNKIYYIDIPQSLKDTATQKGFPLFSKGGYMFQPVEGNPFEPKTELKT